MSKFIHTSKPCVTCPFRRDGEGFTPVRLYADRIHDVVASVSPGEQQGMRFPCHKTVDYEQLDDTDDVVHLDDTLECAGALVFAYKQGGATSNFIRIMERLGAVDEKLATGAWPEIFDTIDEMLETALDAHQPKKAKRKK